jgi:hypothetical protein
LAKSFGSRTAFEFQIAGFAFPPGRYGELGRVTHKSGLMSPLPPKANMQQDILDCPLSADGVAKGGQRAVDFIVGNNGI